MPGVGHRESWDETGSGESSGECDDEDGCEGSGESVASPSELTNKISPTWASMASLYWFDAVLSGMLVLLGKPYFLKGCLHL